MIPSKKNVSRIEMSVVLYSLGLQTSDVALTSLIGKIGLSVDQFSAQ